MAEFQQIRYLACDFHFYTHLEFEHTIVINSHKTTEKLLS